MIDYSADFRGETVGFAGATSVAKVVAMFGIFAPKGAPTRASDFVGAGADRECLGAGLARNSIGLGAGRQCCWSGFSREFLNFASKLFVERFLVL